MDVAERLALIERYPTKEVVDRAELAALLETNPSPRHYIGLEISGFLHLGSLISTGYKINDFVRAGIGCTIFLADWHTMINDKLGGDWDTITAVSRYYEDAFKLVCPGAKIVLGSKLYLDNPEYWADLVGFTRHVSLARTIRTLTIMGRAESDKTQLAKLLYPPMQAVDIHTLDVDIAHSGTDQRKIHMLVREIFPKMGWKVPVAVHHGLLPGLGRPADGAEAAGKMSKSDATSGIFIHNTDEEIRRKIDRAWCQEGETDGSPLLEIARSIIFHESGGLDVERPDKYGGDVSYGSYEQLEEDFDKGRLHPADLKRTVGDELVRIIAPIRESLTMDRELYEKIRASY